MVHLCPVALKIQERDGKCIVKKDGECTPLYYHILDCDDCAELREEVKECTSTKENH